MIIWPISYETTWYQNALPARLQQDLEAHRAYIEQYGVFLQGSSDNTLVRGRHLHLRGDFDGDKDRKGAKTLYMESRLPTAQIEQIDTSDRVRQQLGMIKPKGMRNDEWGQCALPAPRWRQRN